MSHRSDKKFDDREHAGAALGLEMATELPADDYVVIGLLRGGVPVAAEVARSLRGALGAMTVRKLGMPENRELAFGALAFYDGSIARYLNDDLYQRGIRRDGPTRMREIESGTRAELQRLAHKFRKHAPGLADRAVVLCDDGLATGATMKAAVDLTRKLGAKRVLVAVPVAPPEVVRELSLLADQVKSLLEPRDFRAVGVHYRQFASVDENDVLELLRSEA